MMAMAMAKKTLLFKCLFAAIFVFNSLFLYLNFSSRPDDRRPEIPPPRSLFSSQKPWPSLPSYRPWSSDLVNPPKFRSCESYFGNGFLRRVDPLEQRRSGGWFRCRYSETLRSSICEGGRIQMIPGKIEMSRGGEKLESVIGRGEDDEMPKFQDGAFRIEAAAGGGGRSKIGRKLVDGEFLDRYLQSGVVGRHTMRQLIGSIQLVDPADFLCSQWIDEPTLLVTRFEYANVFHTYTDWYSSYVSSRVTGLPRRPHVVFVDGHCQTQLEETWKALFSSINYAKNFSGRVCFNHAVFVPLGYETPLFKGLSEHIDCRNNPRLSEFGEMILSAFGIPTEVKEKKKSTAIDVLFVRREDYLAHPRHGGKVQSRLSNEGEVFDAISEWARNRSAVRVVNGLFAHMPMKEQVEAIRKAAVIVGAHGAGLTHTVSARPDAAVLEIIASQYMRPHFELISRWRGLDYHAIHLPGSRVEPRAVIEKLATILRGFGVT